VVIAWVPTAETGVIQERTGWPPRWTVQAPHWPMPQPYFRTGKIKDVSNYPQQGHIGWGVYRGGAPIHVEFEGHTVSSPD